MYNIHILRKMCLRACITKKKKKKKKKNTQKKTTTTKKKLLYEVKCELHITKVSFLLSSEDSL